MHRQRHSWPAFPLAWRRTKRKLALQRAVDLASVSRPVDTNPVSDFRDTAQTTPLIGDKERDLYSSPLSVIFGRALREAPSVTIRTARLAGAPCIEGTRIPVYVIVDAIRLYGSVDRVLDMFPVLTRSQIEDALR